MQAALLLTPSTRSVPRIEECLAHKKESPLPDRAVQFAGPHLCRRWSVPLCCTDAR